MSRRYPSRPIVGVGALIIGEDGRIVLVRRGAPPLAGRWSLPGGALELGETLATGVAREVVEETGLVIDVGPIIEVFEHISTDDQGRIEYHFVIADYLCRLREGTLMAGTDVDAAIWIEPAELFLYDVTPQVQAVVRRGLELYTAEEKKALMKHILVAVAMVGMLVAPLRAELRYTMRMDAHKSSAPAAATNPLLAMIGSLVIGSIAPAGGVEVTVVVGEHGTRVEYSKPYLMVPAGGAILIDPDGSLVVLNPAAKTYFKVARADAGMIGSLNPVVTVHRTGDVMSILGVKTERATVDIHVAIPMLANAQIPGMPPDLAISGEAWLSAEYKRYAQMSPGLGASIGSLGLDKLSAEGFVMRSIMRSDLFGDQEIESIVTNLSEVSVPASTFQVPDDYAQVEPQMGLPAMPAMPAMPGMGGAR